MIIPRILEARFVVPVLNGFERTYGTSFEVSLLYGLRTEPMIKNYIGPEARTCPCHFLVVRARATFKIRLDRILRRAGFVLATQSFAVSQRDGG